MFECVFVKFQTFFENVFFLYFLLLIIPSCTPARPREANWTFFKFLFFFTFGMAPEMRKRWNWKQKTKWRPHLAQASGLAGFVCLNFFSKGKIAKRVVWMIALAGCAQAGWIARGTRPEQGEPIYILCNLFYIMCTVRHI